MHAKTRAAAPPGRVRGRNASTISHESAHAHCRTESVRPQRFTRPLRSFLLALGRTILALGILVGTTVLGYELARHATPWYSLAAVVVLFIGAGLIVIVLPLKRVGK